MRFKLAIIFLWLSVSLSGQEYFYHHISRDRGLEVPIVNQVVQDAQGWFWVATEGGGVGKFDGVYWDYFTVSDGLPSNFVSSLSFQEDSILWIGTDKGPCFFNGRQIISLKLIPGFPEERVFAIYPHQGEVYFGTVNGLYHYDGTKFRVLENKGAVYQISSLQGELVWAGDRGLRSDLNIISDKPVRCFYMDSTHIWYIEKGVIKSLNDPNFTYPGFDGAREIFKDAQGNFWVATLENGILKFVEDSHQLSPQQSIPRKGWHDIYFDQSGILWFSGVKGMYAQTEPGIQFFSPPNGETEIWSVYPTQEGLWLGGDGQLILKDEKGETTLYNKQLPQALILSIVGHQNRLWLGTEEGLVSFSSSGSKLYRGPTNLANDFFVFDLVVHQEKLLLGTSQGLFAFSEGTFSPFGGFNNDFQIGVTQIQTVDEKIYALQSNGQVFEVSEANHHLVWDPDSMMISRMTAHEGTLILGTFNSGLIFYNDQQFSFSDETDGLLSNQILNLSETQNGAWVMTPSGLQHFDWNQSNSLKYGLVINEEAGIEVKELSANVLELDGYSNTTWLGGKLGYYGLNNEKLANSGVDKKPQITAVELNLQKTGWQDQGFGFPGWAIGPQQPKLDYDQNYLRFRFSHPALVYHQDIDFRFRLKGQKNQWIYPEEFKEAVFTGLAPGRYVFEIQSRRAQPGAEWISGNEYAFSISKPYWATWWYRGTIALVLGAFGFFVVKNRINRIRQTAALQNRMLELESKALRLQMNPHFIFNALESINGFIFKNDQKQAVAYLNAFAKLMRLTLESSREAKIPLQVETETLKNYLTLERLRFSDSFDYSIEVDEELDPYEVLLPPMLVQPIVENALLHGLRPLKSDGNLTVRFERKEKRLIITVTDNGVGRKRAAEIAQKVQKHNSKATQITQERLGILRRKNAFDYQVNIIDLFDSEDQPAGTKVVLVLPYEEDEF